MGKSVVETLAEDLQKELAGSQGYSSSNLWRMKNFYTTYKDNEKLALMVREIGWTKNVLIHQIENQPYKEIMRRFEGL